MTERAQSLIAVVLAGLTVVIVAAVALGGDGPAAPDEQARTDVPFCADVRAGDADVTTCRTERALLTIAPVGRAAALGELEARLTRVRLSDTGPAELIARLRLANRSDRTVRFNADGRQIYVSVGGERVPTASVSPPAEPGSTVQFDARFELTQDIAERLRAGDGEFDLAVRSFSRRGTAPRIAVLRGDVS